MPNFQIPPFAHLTYSDDQGGNQGQDVLTHLPHLEGIRGHLLYQERIKTSDTAGGLQISDVSLLAMDRLETCICIGQS